MQQSEPRHLDRTRVADGVERIYLRASLLTLAGNAFLALAKGTVSYFSGSRAIYADAINSVTDVAFSLMMLLVLRLAVQPADDSHPHGHDRFEPLVSLVIGAMMALAGIEAVRSAVQSLVKGSEPVTGYLGLAMPVATAMLKVAMYLHIRRLGRVAGSPALRAAASDNLSDILAAVVVLVGVGANTLGWTLADPIAALGVSIWIFRNAYQVLSESIGHLVGGAAPPDLYERVREAIAAVPDVLGIDQLIIEYVGPKVRVDIHVVMDSYATLQVVHRVSHAVREAVESLPDVDHAFVHVEPLERLLNSPVER